MNSRFDAFSEDEIKFLKVIIEQSTIFWSPAKDGLLKELNRAYLKKCAKEYGCISGGGL